MWLVLEMGSQWVYVRVGPSFYFARFNLKTSICLQCKRETLDTEFQADVVLTLSPPLPPVHSVPLSSSSVIPAGGQAAAQSMACPDLI